MEQESAGGTGDHAIVEAIAAGDRAGLAAAYDAYAAELFEDCRYRLRDPYRAADAVQDTFLVAWHHIGRLRDPSRLGAWLSALARNECKRIARSNAFLTDEERPRLDDNAAVPLPEPLKEQIMLLLDEPGGEEYAAEVAGHAGAWRRDGFPQPIDGRLRAYSAAGTITLASVVVLTMVILFLVLAQPTAAKHTTGDNITNAQIIGPAPLTSLPPPLTPPPPPSIKPSTTTPTPTPSTATPTTTRPGPSRTPTIPITFPPTSPISGSISVSPTALQVPAGGGGSFTITAVGGPADYSISYSASQLSVSPSSGSLGPDEQVTVTVTVLHYSRRNPVDTLYVNGIPVTVYSSVGVTP